MKIAYFTFDDDLFYLTLKNDQTVWTSSQEMFEDEEIEYLKLEDSEWDTFFDLCPFEFKSLPITINFQELD